MAQAPPVWLLDVDGVINATRPGWGAAPRRAPVWSATDGRSYPLRWAPPLVDRIRRLHDSGAVEVRWCSTWCPDADSLEQLWRLPVLVRALDADPMPRGAECWALKLAAARAVLAEERSLIWTDDEATPAEGPIYDELTADGRALLVTPLASRGLQPDDLDRIEEFCAGR